MKPPPPVRHAARARQQAVERRDLAAAQRLTTEILAQGWVVSDTTDGYSLQPRTPLEPAGRSLADYTTLRLGGPARRLVRAETEAELVDVVREADASGEPVLVLGAGSNLVVSDDGFAGVVVQVATRGVTRDGDHHAVAAGEGWDGFVLDVLSAGRVGVEALSGIPGLVGATPIQNVGAYGQDVAQTVTAVRVLDRTSGRVRALTPDECRFGYRHSAFKGSQRYVVLGVTFDLPVAPAGRPLRYAGLASHLGLRVGDLAPAPAVREAVLDLRRSKGMVLDPADHDTWSAGSFFTNPVLDAADAARLPPDAPRWPEPDGRVKTSAAWLIEQAGFAPGYGEGPVRLSTKHTLALTNRGDASTEQLLALARTLREGVRERFGVTLDHEPVLVGVSL
ncbi:MAG: UDP-N-acetylmuramate dehydrogenase [Actinomycetota bacterium]|nr:UDP-N-acetylmuramate dehydrogenase [Actinomycetota bacterium]